MKIKGTPVIVRQDTHGELVALFPTMPGAMSDPDQCATLDARGSHFRNENYKTFIKRTEPVAERVAQNYAQHIRFDGTYTATKTITARMHQQRRGNLRNNPDMLPHDNTQEL